MSPTASINGTPACRAFSLIELLVAVGIIAILAAIAIPNYLSAQMRAKVARCSADMRAVATALEAYAVDNKAFPTSNVYGTALARPSVPGDPPVLERLTTPVAYLTSLPTNPFTPISMSGPTITGLGDSFEVDPRKWVALPPSQDSASFRCYPYTALADSSVNISGIGRVLHGETVPSTPPPSAPNRDNASAYMLQSAGPLLGYINMGGVIANANEAYSAKLIYDPTNGTASFGNLYRLGGTATHSDNFLSMGKKAGS